MRFGLLIPNWAPYDQDLMIRMCVEAEELGVDQVFFTDHLMNPYGPRMNLPEQTVEVWTLMAHLAAKTSRVRLATAVTPISLRHPALLAKMVATVDNLSNGRVVLGVGTGWHQPEYDAYGDSEYGTPATRKARMREGLDLIRRLWTEDEVTFKGEYYSVTNCVVAPKPLQKPYPPLWIGGYRPHMLEYAAMLGDGWIPWNRPVPFYTECVQEIRRQAKAQGREGKIVLGTGVLVLPDRLRNEKFPLVHGDPPNLTIGALPPRIEEYAKAGAEFFGIMIFPETDALQSLRQFGREVMPQFRK